MLPRKHRLRDEHDIIRVVRRGKCTSTALVRVCVDLPQTDVVRIGCVAGKKVSRLAVKRHYYQRLLRSVAASLIPQLTKEAQIKDILLIAQSGIDQKKVNLDSVKADVVAALRRLGLTL